MQIPPNYQNINNFELNKELRQLYLNNLNQFKQILDELKSSERYQLDYIFNIIIDSQLLAYHLVNDKLAIINESIDDLFERVENAGHNDALIISYNILGNAYTTINQTNRAIICYYQVINYCKNNSEMKILAATALHNIGEIYRNFEDYERTLYYLTQAHQLLADLPTGDKEHDSFWFYNCCDLTNLEYQLGNVDRSFHYYRLCRDNMPENINNLSTATFKTVQMRFLYLDGDLKSIDTIFDELSEQLIETNDYYMLSSYSLSYYDYARKLKADLAHLIPKLCKVYEFCEGKANYKDEAKILSYIIDYYIAEKQYEKAHPYIEKYAKAIKNNDAIIDLEQNKFIDIQHEKYLFSQHNNQYLEEKQKLQQYREEISDKQRQIQHLFRRLNAIDKFASAIISANSYQELILSSYKILKKIIRTDSYNIISYNSATHKINCYFSRNIYEEITDYEITLEKEKKQLEKLFADKRPIIINDYKKNKTIYQLIKKLHPHAQLYNAAIINPVISKEKTIAICLILSIEKNAYAHISYEFIEQISTFISITINNIAIKEKMQEVITKDKNTKEKMEDINNYLNKLSQEDALTKVYNRRAFDEFYQKQLKKIKSKQEKMSLFMIDIDHFKEYNDNLGHLAGDKVLAQIAKTLFRNFRSDQQILARYGGEEFIAFFQHKTAEEAYNKAEKIRKEIEKLNIKHPQHNYPDVTISIGLATINTVKEKDRDYIEIADKALYQAKENGRNQVVQIIKD